MGRFDTYLKQEEPAEAAPEIVPPHPPQSIALPLSPERQAALQAKIDAGMSPLPGGLGTAWDALRDANQAAGQQLGHKAFFGIPGRLADAADSALGITPRPVDAIPAPGKKSKRWDDYLPDEQALNVGTGLASAGLDMATMRVPSGMAVNMAKRAGANLIEQEAIKDAGFVGPAIGQAPAAIARRLGASEAATVVRPSLQTAANAGGAGAVFGGADAAIRGGGPSDVLEGAAQGAAGNIAMSQIPRAFSAAEDIGNRAITSRAVKPLVGIGQGVKADKALAGLGKGDVELGEKELARVVEENGLAPIVNGRAKNLQSQFDAKLEDVWKNELGPVRATALEAEPTAKVSIRKIEERLRALVGEENKGTDAHDDVNKAIDLLKARAEAIGTKGQFPVKNLLKNAQEFEQDGFGKSQPKFTDGRIARAIGKELRGLTDERIGQIYAKNPKLVQKVIGRQEPQAEPRLLDTGEPNPDFVEPASRKPWERSQTDDLDLETLGEKYADARKHYADLKKIEPLVDQLAKRNAEHRPGLVPALKHIAGNSTAAMVGYGVGGQHGVLAGLGAAEAGRLSMPYLERATAATGGFGSGPAVSPYLSGAELSRMTLPQLSEYAASMPQRRKIEQERKKQVGYQRQKAAERRGE